MKTYLKLYHKSRGSGKSCVTTVVGGSLCASKMWENGVVFLNFRRYRWFKWPKANCLNVWIVNISKRLNISSVRSQWDHFVQQLMSSDQYSHTHHNTPNHVHTSWDIMCGPFWLTLTIHQQPSPPENIMWKSTKKVNKLRNYIFPAPNRKMAQNIAPSPFSWKLVMLMSILPTCGAVKVDMSHKRLDAVPQTVELIVTEWNLAGNDFNILDANNSFKIYVNLVVLNLDTCKIKYIYDGTFAMQDKLEMLSIRYNDIHHLPLHFGPSLNSLLNLQMWQAFSLEYELRPPYFSTFKRLREILIGGRDYKLSNMGIPISITIIKVMSMSLTVFPDFSNATGVEKMYVDGVDFISIPDEYIKTFTAMSVFSIRNCLLQVMPNLSHMERLKMLWFRSNPIRKIPRHTIEGLRILQLFYFEDHKIEVMPNVSYLSTVKNIQLRYNRIRHVPASTILGLPNLKFLSLIGNMISSIEDIPQLVAGSGKVLLADNQLEILPDLFDRTLERLNIGGNPLLCDQSLCWLRMWPWFKTLPNVDNPVCVRPPDLNGTAVMEVHPLLLICYNGGHGDVVFQCCLIGLT